MRHIKFIVAIILMLIVVVLIVQNNEAMSTRVGFKVDLIVFKYETSNLSVYHIVTIAFLFGVIVSGLYGIVERFRLKKQLKVLMLSNQEKDEELNSLRNLPITSDDVIAEPASNAHN